MPITRDQALDEARSALQKAARLAEHAEQAAHSNDPNRRSQTERLAAAGALWADASRAYSELAAVLPETETADA